MSSLNSILSELSLLLCTLCSFIIGTLHWSFRVQISHCVEQWLYYNYNYNIICIAWLYSAVEGQLTMLHTVKHKNCTMKAMVQ